MADDTAARMKAIALWVLLVLAILGGLLAFLRGAPSPSPTPQADGGEAALSEGWAAAGFGQRFVAAYLSASPSTAQGLASFLGYTPELPSTSPARPASVPTAAVGVERVGEQYWAVTVVAGSGDTEGFWRVGVLGTAAGLVAVGLPTPVPGPVPGERPELAVALSAVPAGGQDPVVDTVAGFVAAYMCGQGDLDRYLRPGVAVAVVVPPACAVAQLDRWGTRELSDDRLEVVAEALLDPGPAARRVTVALVLARRDGRWEIAEVLPAVPLAETKDKKVKETS